MFQSSIRRVTGALLVAATWVFFSVATAHAAKWWNPLTWFEGNEAVKAENTKYKAERPMLVQTLDEAKATGDKATIKQARKELRDYDKAHSKRIKAIRKQVHEEERLAHKEAHKAKKDEKKELKAATKDEKKADKVTGLDKADERANENAEFGLKTARTAQSKEKGAGFQKRPMPDMDKETFADDEERIFSDRAHSRGVGQGQGRGKGR